MWSDTHDVANNPASLFRTGVTAMPGCGAGSSCPSWSGGELLGAGAGPALRLAWRSTRRDTTSKSRRPRSGSSPRTSGDLCAPAIAYFPSTTRVAVAPLMRTCLLHQMGIEDTENSGETPCSSFVFRPRFRVAVNGIEKTRSVRAASVAGTWSETCHAMRAFSLQSPSSWSFARIRSKRCVAAAIALCCSRSNPPSVLTGTSTSN